MKRYIKFSDRLQADCRSDFLHNLYYIKTGQNGTFPVEEYQGFPYIEIVSGFEEFFSESELNAAITIENFEDLDSLVIVPFTDKRAFFAGLNIQDELRQVTITVRVKFNNGDEDKIVTRTTSNERKVITPWGEMGEYDYFKLAINNGVSLQNLVETEMNNMEANGHL